MMATGGYHGFEIIEGSNKDLVECIHCNGILRDAMELACGHLVCETCWKHIEEESTLETKCPSCGLVCTRSEVRDSRQGNRYVSNLKVSCSKKNYGCGWTGSIADFFNSHEESCSKSLHENIIQNLTIDVKLLKNENDKLKNYWQEQKNEVTILSQEIKALKIEKGNTAKELNTANENIEQLRNELEELKSSSIKRQMREEALAMDQHNATNEPPGPPKPRFVLTENIFVCGFEKFIEKSDPYYPVNIENYADWYNNIHDILYDIMRYPNYLFMKVKLNTKYSKVIWESSNAALRVPTRAKYEENTKYLTVSTKTFNDGWKRENVKCVIILHPTDVNESLEMYFKDDSQWTTNKVKDGHYNKSIYLILCAKKR